MQMFLWILEISLFWAIVGKSIPASSTTDQSRHAWTQSTGQLGHSGGNNKWHKQTLCWDQKAIMHECFHTGHRTWSRLSPSLIGCLSSLSPWFYSSCEFPTRQKRHDKFFPAISPKRAISDVTTGRLSAIQPLSQSYHTRPVGMQDPGPAGG